MPLFSRNDIDLPKPPTEEKKETFTTANVDSISLLETTAVEEISEFIDEQKTICFWSHGKWSQHDLLALLLRKLGGGTVHLSTWQFSEEAARVFGAAIEEGLISKLYCVFDYRIKSRKPKPFQLMQQYATKYVLTQIHAKVFVIQNDDRYATVISSANFSKNKRIEAGTILYDASVAKFYQNQINHEISTLSNE